MFDIGFWELAVIGVVALIVIGPEKLPTVARTAGLWVSRARRFIVTVKDDINRELKAEELKQLMEKEKNANPIHEFIEQTKADLSLDELNDKQTSAEQKPGSTEPHDK